MKKLLLLLSERHGRKRRCAKIAQNFCRLVKFFYTREMGCATESGSAVNS
ncbi:hypothetical protein AXX16_3751 [Serratia rubidaea]|nr:hypothetical protein AXX16_3751 [Serratia rubidaea]